MVKRFNVTLPALTGEKERRAFVYLPVGYDEKPEKRYPVLYMFDGHNLFTDEEATYGRCWGLAEYLDGAEVPLIVAAVECNHEGNCRLSEYSPVSFSFRGEKIVGRGKKYMDWLTGQFKPLIDGAYNTLPDRKNTFVAGSSMGGLMTLYALAAYGKFFSRGAALSPSLWVGGGDMPKFICGGRYRKDAVLYMDYGGAEFSNHPEQRSAFCKAYEALVQRGVSATASVVPDGTHCEQSWSKRIPVFMKIFGLQR